MSAASFISIIETLSGPVDFPFFRLLMTFRTVVALTDVKVESFVRHLK